MTTQTLRTASIAMAHDYQELPAWKKATVLAERIYALTEDFPEREHGGLARDIRASAVAISTHIAQGSAKNNEHGIAENYSDAQAATASLTTQLTIAKALGYVGVGDMANLALEVDEVSRLLIGLKHGLKLAAREAERAERDAARTAREAAEAERPRREYKPRDGGDDRPRREYKPRDDAGERKSYGDKKTYGEKKAYGDRKPYGDKKPYGDRKPSGGKPFRKPRP